MLKKIKIKKNIFYFIQNKKNILIKNLEFIKKIYP